MVKTAIEILWFGRNLLCLLLPLLLAPQSVAKTKGAAAAAEAEASEKLYSYLDIGSVTCNSASSFF
jgi:hypothetical protein